METKVLKANRTNIEYAARLIMQDEIIGFPTETVYGLGANVFSKKAVAKIFKAKDRPADNPLIVHIAELSQLEEIAFNLNNLEKQIVDLFWPGPLSIILKVKPVIPKIVTAGLDTVAVRMPAHPIAKQIINAANVPIAAPSANLSSKPSATSAQYVLDDFKGKILLIIDGDSCQFGLESTVVKVTNGQINILRPGAITKEMLEKVAPTEYKKFQQDGTPMSPGVKHPHYNPNAKVILVMGDNKREIKEKIYIAKNKTKKQAFYGFDKIVDEKDFVISMILKGEDCLYEYAKNLYSFFRDCDKIGIEEIITHQVPAKGLGHAIMNRINKASDLVV